MNCDRINLVFEFMRIAPKISMKKGSSALYAIASGLLIVGLVFGFTATVNAAEAPDNKYAVALVIGNKGYVNKRIPAVDYAHNDAAAMTRYLIDVRGYRKGNIIDLRDATQGQMEAALGNSRTHEGTLWQWLRPGKSDVTVFYSGHGVPGLKDKRGYLLPVNADPEKPEINGYPLDILYANLAKLKARSVTVYLDTCFSGDSGGGILIRGASGLVVTPKLPKSSSRLTVLTAAKADQVASWDEKNKHGLFTNYLLAALYGKADGNGDGEISVGEVKTYLDDEMTYAARRTYGRKQTASLQGDPTTILGAVPKGGRPTVAASKQATPEVAALSPSTAAIEQLDETYVVIKTANVRAKPDAKSGKVMTLGIDTGVQVTGRTADGKWLRIAHGGRDAFIWGSLVKSIDAGELSAWGKIKDSRVKSVIEGFLSDYPSGHYSGRAAHLVAALTPLPKAAVPTQQPSPSVQPAVGVYLQPGKRFRDCADCPEMVVVPAGSFRMGDLSGGGDSDEKPVHQVTIPRAFAVGKYEVTRGAYALFARATGRSSGDGCYVYDGKKWLNEYSKDWQNPGYSQTERDPVSCVNWDDAKAYVSWLSDKTGKQYRLLSESEWEYAARSRSATKYSFGDSESSLCRHGNGADSSTGFKWKNASCNDGYGEKTAPVGSFEANGFGLHDMHGNVWEWTEDCWNENYNGAPDDGEARTTGSCTERVLRGGSWYSEPGFLRAAYRYGFFTSFRNYSEFGFRIARTL